MWLLIIVVVAIVLLIYLEYKDQDCIGGKNCRRSVPKPSPDDDYLAYLDKIKAMVKNNYNYINWRLALLVGLILAFPVVYFLKGRIPNPLELIVVGGLIFMATYLSAGWIWAHFFYPNGQEIEKNIMQLRDIIQKSNYNPPPAISTNNPRSSTKN